MAIDLATILPAALFKAAFAVEDQALPAYLDAPEAISLRKWRSLARRDRYLGRHRADALTPDDPDRMSTDVFLAAFAMRPEQLDELTRDGILEMRSGDLTMESIRRFTSLLMAKRLVVWSNPTEELFAAHNLARFAPTALAEASEVIRLIPTSQQTRSRLGGTPDLDDRPWPEHNGKPLAFVSQLDLLELSRQIPRPNLPAAGVLSFFYVAEWDAPGYDPASRTGWQVYWIQDTVTPRALPETMSGLGRFEPVNVQFKQTLCLPSPRSNAIDELRLSGAELDRYEDLWWEVAGNEPHHWIGGHPDIVQNDDIFETCQLAANGVFAGDSSAVASEAGRALVQNAGDWQLLLQVWNDDDAGMLWADSGCLYFCIRREDLRNGAFDRTWCVMESL